MGEGDFNDATLERFIELIKSEQAIWDKGHNDHKQKNRLHLIFVRLDSQLKNEGLTNKHG